MDAWRRVVGIVLHPNAEWERIAAEDTTVDVLIRHFLLPLALLAPIATFIGIKFFDASWDEDLGYLVPPQDAFAAAATTLFATLTSVFGLAGIFVLLGPLYGSSRDYRVALKVATFGAVPMLLAGVLMFLPVLALLGLFGLSYTLYLYWLGARAVLQVPRKNQAEFIGIAMLLLIVASSLGGAAASSIGLI